MENSFKFFKNEKCEYFPCHKSDDNVKDFNCLFCYCPLYSLGEKCGGNFKYSETSSIKICTDCCLPHMPQYYDVIISKLKEMIKKEKP